MSRQCADDDPRVYRQRKTRYIKNLEKDVENSRQRECQLSVEKADLENDVQTLLHILSKHNIKTPDISIARDSRRGPRQSTRALPSAGVAHHPERPQAQTFPPSPIPPSFSSTDGAVMASRVCEFDQTTLGMIFVLKYLRIFVLMPYMG